MIHLDRSAGLSMRQQVYARVRDVIVGGQFAPGTQLPSSRVLAAELAISRNTVVSAFEQLIAEGYLESKTGAGSFVPAEIPDSLTMSKRAAPHVVRPMAPPLPLSAAGEAL